MKKINLLIVIIFALHIFTNANATEDNNTPHPNDPNACYTALTNKALDEIIERALKNGIEQTAEKLSIPFELLSNWLDDRVGSILTNILEETEETTEASLLKVSYWGLMYTPKPPTEIEKELAVELIKTSITLQQAITAVAERLNISPRPLFYWLADRDIQLSFLHSIAQRTEEGTLSDWIYEYKAEIDRLQFLPQYAGSLLYGNSRYEAVQLALKSSIEETARQLNIPYTFLSLFVFRYERNRSGITQKEDIPLTLKEDMIADARRMSNTGMTINDIARDLGISAGILVRWLRSVTQLSYRLPSSLMDIDD